MSGCVELFAKHVVIETAISAGDAGISTRCGERTTLGAQRYLRRARRSRRAEHLHNTGERVRAVEHALGPTHELKTVSSDGGDDTEIEGSTGFIDGHAIDDDFVVTRVPAAHEK